MPDSPLIRIVDDDPELLDSQKMLLETLGWEVITYRSGQDFLSHDSLQRPGCIVLDVRMPGMTGIEVQEELEKRGISHISIIFLSAHGDIAMAAHAMRHGAVDFVQKPAEPHYMLERVAASVAASVKKDDREHELKRLEELVSKLSPRELDVARGIADGLRNKQIAIKLGIEETTVKMHRANALQKLEARSSAELVRIFTILDYADPGQGREK
ncbi:MAG: response regulator [Sutterellaceae bacterium]|nr:response regulator [Sutterellaceae bacterium]MDD7441548.1 response regulator [Sutterellaceae bacterium]MDY2867277.1 response regulator [Mesosutterella sp.]